LNETKQSKSQPPPPVIQTPPQDVKDSDGLDLEELDFEPENPPIVEADLAKKPEAEPESVGTVSEVEKIGKKKGAEGDEKEEVKKSITVVEEGIKCTVYLSLKTLSLYQIAATLQKRHDGTLTLGDFLDTTAEDFFRVRGKHLGLITIKEE